MWQITGHFHSENPKSYHLITCTDTSAAYLFVTDSTSRGDFSHASWDPEKNPRIMKKNWISCR